MQCSYCSIMHSQGTENEREWKVNKTKIKTSSERIYTHTRTHTSKAAHKRIFRREECWYVKMFKLHTHAALMFIVHKKNNKCTHNSLLCFFFPSFLILQFFVVFLRLLRTPNNKKKDRIQFSCQIAMGTVCFVR